MLEILQNKNILPVSTGKTISSYTNISDNKEVILYNDATSTLYILKMNISEEKLKLAISKNGITDTSSVEMKLSSTSSKLLLYDNISLVFFIKKNNLYIIAPDGYELYC